MEESREVSEPSGRYVAQFTELAPVAPESATPEQMRKALVAVGLGSIASWDDDGEAK